MALKGGPVPSSTRFRRTSDDGGLRTCMLLLAISLVIFTMSVREGDNGGIFSSTRGVWMTITTPMRWVGGAATAPFHGLGNVVANLTVDQERLSELKAENERLVARNAELEEAAQTAARLESLLGLQSLYSLQSTGARIISGATDSWSSTVTIDKGTSSGFSVGMPVTDSNGAIGQIIKCGPTSSTVRLITDENSSVSAMIQSSRAQGILKGSVDGSLRLTLVRTDQMVEVGDTVITSGLGGVYPKGLPLGKVSSVERVSGSMYYEIEIEQLSSVQSFEEVLVITSLTEEQKATAEDVAEADRQAGSSGGAIADANASGEDDGEDTGGGDVSTDEAATEDASGEAAADAGGDA